jgi:hypothetical protein
MKKMMLFVVLLMGWATVAGQTQPDLSSVEQNLETVQANLDKISEVSLKQVEANMKQVEANMKQVEANLEQLETNLKQEQAHLENLSSDNDEKEPFAVYKFPVKAIEKVTVQTAGGSIRVNGDFTEALEEATVEVWISPNSRIKGEKLSKEEIQKILDEYYTLAVTAERGELSAEARRIGTREWNSKNNVSISFRLSVPQKVTAQLATSGGSIHIRNLEGKEELTTSGGSIHVEDVSGTVTGRTSGGSIHLSGSKGEIKLSTSGGSIRAKNNQGNVTLNTSGGSLHIDDCSGTVTAATSGGSIHLSDLTGTVNATTSGGSVRANRVNGDLTTGTTGGGMRLMKIAGNLDAKASAGRMEVQMLSVAGYVRLKNTGSITLTLPAGKRYNLQIRGRKIETRTIKKFQGTFESNNIEGAMNGGGAEINVKSSQLVKLAFE